MTVKKHYYVQMGEKHKYSLISNNVNIRLNVEIFDGQLLEL